MADPILDLSTLAPERPFIRIDGARHDLRVSGDFGIRELAGYNRLTTEAIELQSRVDTDAPLTDEEAERLSSLLGDAVRYVLMAPDAVVAKLSDEQRMAVLAAFTNTASRAATPTNRKRRRSTSVRSRHASRRATAPTTG